MNIHDSFPSKFLKPRDLAGKQPAVVIRTVEPQSMRVDGGKPVTKLVVYFERKEKGLVLNKTNALAIATIVGSDETDQWIGKTIRLYAATTKFGASMVPCVRVRAADVVIAAERLA